MNSELEVLKKIWQNRKTNIRVMSKHIGMSIDYIDYICKYLAKKGDIKPVMNHRGWYQITSQTEKALKNQGIIRNKESKKNDLHDRLSSQQAGKAGFINFNLFKLLKEKFIRIKKKRVNLPPIIAKKVVCFVKQGLKAR